MVPIIAGTLGVGDESLPEVATAHMPTGNVARIARLTWSGIVYSTNTSASTAITESFTVTIHTGETFGPFELPDTDQAYTFEVDFVTSTLRFDVETSTGGNTGIREVAAYGSPITP